MAFGFQIDPFEFGDLVAEWLADVADTNMRSLVGQGEKAEVLSKAAASA